MKSKIIIGIIVLAILIGFSSFALAEENAFTKLGRGVVNTATGWLEIPKKIYDTSKDENVFVGLTVGTAKGLGWGITRTAVGIYEIVTFPFPIPESYEPIVEPEYIFTAE